MEIVKKIFDILLFVVIFGGMFVLIVIPFVFSFRKKYNDKRLDPKKRVEMKNKEEENNKWALNLLPFIAGGVLAKSGLDGSFILMLIIAWFVLVALFRYVPKMIRKTKNYEKK